MVAGRQIMGILKADSGRARYVQLVGRLVGHPAADDQQSVDAVRFDRAGDGVKLLDGGDLAIGAQLAAPQRGPAFDIAPGEFLDPAGQQALETAAHSEQRMAAIETKADGGADGRIHPRRQSAGVNDRQAARGRWGDAR
jgi:hypothetical protein